MNHLTSCRWTCHTLLFSLRRIVRSRPKWPTCELCTLLIILYCSRLSLNFSIILADMIVSSEYSWGWSAMLSRLSRDIESAMSLLTPEINSILNQNSGKARSQRTIIGFEWFLMYNKLRWSVRKVNILSRNSDFKYVHAKKIAYASFCMTAHRSWALLSDLLTNATGVSFPSTVWKR